MLLNEYWYYKNSCIKAKRRINCEFGSLISDIYNYPCKHKVYSPTTAYSTYASLS